MCVSFEHVDIIITVRALESCVNHAITGVGSGLKLDFSLRTQFNITRRLLGHKSEILIVCPPNSRANLHARVLCSRIDVVFR